MRNIRRYIPLLFLINCTLLSFGCSVNIESKDSSVSAEKKKELKKKAIEGWGGERTEHMPPEPMK